jgi:hypothetical protein
VAVIPIFLCVWLPGFFQASAQQLALLEIQYLLQLIDIVCAYHLDISSNLVDHHGELLIQNGALVDLQ